MLGIMDLYMEYITELAKHMSRRSFKELVNLLRLLIIFLPGLVLV